MLCCHIVTAVSDLFILDLSAFFQKKTIIFIILYNFQIIFSSILKITSLGTKLCRETKFFYKTKNFKTKLRKLQRVPQLKFEANRSTLYSLLYKEFCTGTADCTKGQLFVQLQLYKRLCTFTADCTRDYVLLQLTVQGIMYLYS